ncbi:DUF1836 domain-containing protein [Paenibacillus xerothermodurans]|uniref:DUF1836 domain-containing protein n=1 Tax=Paenibacillus xerothermodurans TaxID=1977292 RepID=A0A2W1N866_PAEXE|nr:DUF1836 domain-containing protein [Paenibacillus xerothermodurans]PZE20607.1 DUF1836 domain-containing protein [Paenibacillus xerothermodurans]
METFTLTRREMAVILLSMQGKVSTTPLSILQEAWKKNHQADVAHGHSLTAFLSTELTPVLEKMMKHDRVEGFSLQEIVSLGNQIEYTHMSITSMQNWVKRDFKEFLGSPKVGKKYSIDQAAMLFIIDDLKNCLDFESIRKLFEIVFRNPDTESDDLLTPVELYAAYSRLFEEMDANHDQIMDVRGHGTANRSYDTLTELAIRQKAEEYTHGLTHLTPQQQEAVRNMLFIAMVSVRNAYFHALARRYLHAALFLHTLN